MPTTPMSVKPKRDLEIQFEERFKKLNPEQKRVVETIEGPLLVVAGPGSGKTEILSMRVAEILRKTHAQPANILCLTFTDSAAINMRDRLAKLIGDSAYQVAIHTFHNFCVDIIRTHGEFFYQGATFTPADEILQISVLESIFNSLSFDDPLRSYHPTEGYVYLKSVLHSISYIKKAGITPDELSILLTDNIIGLNKVENILLPVIEKRLNSSSADEIQSALNKLIDETSKESQIRRAQVLDKAEENQRLSIAHLFSIYKPIEEAIILSLTEVVGHVRESGKNDALTNWKKKQLRKDEQGKTILRDRANEDKMKSLGNIYKTYQTYMYNAGYFDFDDMILDVIKVLYAKPELRYLLQEQFQYVLVDEFQDTNNAQMRILSLLAESEVHHGHPNIMVVGDDDQAIYKFQGAELSNILDFQHRYTDVSLVSLVRNYRSTQDILNIAMNVIRKGEKRLENLIPDLSKQLVASGAINKGNIEYVSLETVLHEYTYVSHTIKSLIKDKGIDPKDIAIIARKHGQLEALVPYMRKEDIPIKYEREQNVFEEPHIKELITISRYIASLVSAFAYEKPKDELLPEILSYAFWDIPRIDIWQLSLMASRQNKTWLEVMLQSDKAHIKSIAEFFIELAGSAPSAPLELVLDSIIGAHISLASEGDEVDFLDGTSSHISKNKAGQSSFVSPFRQFYFSKEKFSHARSQYLTFLSSLRVFIQALRDYNGVHIEIKKDKDQYRTLHLIDLIRFVDMYQKNGLRLNDKSPFVTARNAVELMSAHSSKGLEFKVVFVLSCQDDVWAGRGLNNKISFPLNIPIEPAGDNEDDQLRLFYVALTRAKEHLYLTSHQIKDSGKPAQDLRFLVDVLTPDTSKKASEEDDLITPEVLETTALKYRTPVFIDSEEALLRGMMDQYTLSVTHLNNFLNIPKGGPMYFLEQNILRFPQSKSISSAYGSAIHNTLEYALQGLRDTKKIPSTEHILEIFETMLHKQKLHPDDMALLLNRGKESLKAFFDNQSKSFSIEDIPEMDFARDHIVIGTVTDTGGIEREVRVTGKIDKVSHDGRDITVHDYKTGHAITSLVEPNRDEEEKAFFYNNQLLFYKLLIENSSISTRYKELRDKKVERGVIDFVEPVGKNKEIKSIEKALEDTEVSDLKRLIVSVYSRIINLQFDIPSEILEKYETGQYTKDIDLIKEFAQFLITEQKHH